MRGDSKCHSQRQSAAASFSAERAGIMPAGGKGFMRAKLAAVAMRMAVIVAAGLTLGGCSSINGALSNAVADNLPQWAGGLPENAPPRPGHPKYEEFMQAQMAKRLDADSVQQTAKPTSKQTPPTRPPQPAAAAAAQPPMRAQTNGQVVRDAAGGSTSAGGAKLNIHSIY
jgi:hypothetical protein